MTSIRRLVASTALAFSFSSAAFAADPELTVFDWAGFENEALIAPYVAKYGEMPTYSFYGDDDEAFQKVSSGFKAEVGHPCAQMVQKYRDAGLIEPWDISKIPNYGEIGERYKGSKIFADDGGVWYIPTDGAYTAVAYNTEKVTADQVASLQVFVDPAFAGKISLPDNTDDTWSLALLATGVSDWSNITDEQFTAAAAWLRQAHANVRTYWADPSELAQLMKTGEVVIAWTWNDGVAAMKTEGVPVAFQRTPKEGVANWFCGYVNFKDGPGKEEKAYDFINAWLDHGSAKGLLDNFGYVHSNDVAMKDIPIEELKAHDVDPITGTLLSQVPIDPAMRDRMTQEFEMIKSGF
jgi:spermidine/putrescine transport system substrate-binding protein